MTDTDHLIWSNYCLDYDDWKDDMEAEYQKTRRKDIFNLAENFGEVTE